jgi:hypothetical protein
MWLQVVVESPPRVEACRSCGVIAHSHGRLTLRLLREKQATAERIQATSDGVWSTSGCPASRSTTRRGAVWIGLGPDGVEQVGIVAFTLSAALVTVVGVRSWMWPARVVGGRW